MLESGEEDTTAGEDAEVAKGGGGGDDKAGEGRGGGDREGSTWSSAHPKRVKVLSKEEADKTSIFDVVLPLPGEERASYMRNQCQM